MLPLSDEEFDRQFAIATERGQERLETGPTVKTAKWHATQGLQLELSNGVRLSVPQSALPELQRATPQQLETIRVLGPGTAVCWPDIDEQIDVLELLALPGNSARE